MDATYQPSLRELNEANFARFDAKLEQRIAEVKMEIGSLHGQLDVRLAEQRASVIAQIASSESRLIRWMVTLWTSSMLATVGLLIAVLRRG